MKSPKACCVVLVLLVSEYEKQPLDPLSRIEQARRHGDGGMVLGEKRLHDTAVERVVVHLGKEAALEHSGVGIGTIVWGLVGTGVLEHQEPRRAPPGN